MTKFSIFLVACISLALLFACNQERGPVLEELDLMSYQMPIVIQAPAGAEVKKLDLVIQKDITVKKGDDFYIQIFESDATERDLEKVKERMISEVKQNPYFSEILMEEERGFIYKTQIDSTRTNYGFRYARIQADKEYTFQAGMIGIFSMDQVETMYNAVKEK